MEHSLFDRLRQKRMTVRLFICLFAIAAFYAAVCTPLSRFVLSDVLLSGTMLPLFLDALLLICNYLFYWIAFAFLVFALIRRDLRSCKPMLAVYAAAVVFRYLANQIADFCVVGFPPINDFFSLYLPYCLLDVLFDFLQMGIVVWVTLALKSGANNPNGILESEMPLTKLWDWKKRSLRAVFCAAAVPAAVRLLSRIRYDIWYGIPRGMSDLLWMIAAYLFDVACLWIGYFFILILFNRFWGREKEANSEG
ncbi:MAG: hypothetical protein IKJ35_06230 [Clostridia bacterium]|nr:hypothetical protein [Clostridia bacterium]